MTTLKTADNSLEEIRYKGCCHKKCEIALQQQKLQRLTERDSLRAEWRDICGSHREEGNDAPCSQALQLALRLLAERQRGAASRFKSETRSKREAQRIRVAYGL